MEAEISSETFYLCFYLTVQHHAANLGNLHALLTICIVICDGSFHTLAAILYTQNAEILHALTSWGDRGDQNKHLMSRNCMSEMRPCSATDRQIQSDWIWKSTNPQTCSKQKCISYQFRAHVETYGHRPGYTANGDASEIDVCPKKMLVCCLMVAAASTIREMRSSSEAISHRHLQRSLDWTERVNGVASQVGGPHTNWLLPVGPLKPWFTRRQLILKWILFLLLLRQQQPSGNNLTFLSAHVKFCCVVFGCVSRSVAIFLNICSKLVRNAFFLKKKKKNTSVDLLDFQP